MARTILITGASGYIGSHCAKYFSRSGFDIVGLDLREPPEPLRPYLKAWSQADIADEKTVADLCQEHRFDGMLHCAALCLVGESMKDPDRYYDYNLVRARKLINVIEKEKVGAVLFSSTAAVYGEPKKLPMPEDHPKRPINPYGETKFAFENDLLARAAGEKFKLGIFRYFNAAGADPEAEIGETHDPETHLIPNVIRAGLGISNELQVFGNDYPTRDGTCERDYFHVWDLADAHFRLMQRMIEAGEGGTYNIGTGNGFTINEIIKRS